MCLVASIRAVNKIMMGSVELSPFQERLKQLPAPVEITSFLLEENCDTCPQATEFLEELERLSPNITVRRYDLVRDRDKAVEMGVEKSPAFLLPTDGHHRVRWYGLPLGLETKTFVDDLFLAAGEAAKVHEQIQETVRRVTRPVHIQVFVTPTCPYCPKAAHLAHVFARLNPLVSADVLEANEFPTVSEVYGVSGVPKIVLNNLLQIEGMPQDQAFAQLVEYAGNPELLAQVLHRKSPPPS